MNPKRSLPRIDPVYWEIRFPVSTTEHTATYYAECPTRFTRIVGNVLGDGVELLSLTVGKHEQLAVSPVDLVHFPARSTNTLLLETAHKQQVALKIRVRAPAAARALLVGPAYNGAHRVYRLDENRTSDEYVIMIEGVCAPEMRAA